MNVRGIRGATTVENNDADEIVQASKEMLEKLVNDNDIVPADISQVWFTVTPDLNAVFPAKALRLLEGFQFVPVMCAKEIDVPGSLSQCIRVMVTVNTAKSQEEIRHVYLKEAVKLRPDLSLTKRI